MIRDPIGFDDAMQLLQEGGCSGEFIQNFLVAMETKKAKDLLCMLRCQRNLQLGKRYITDHYAELCSAENIANEVNLSPNYLRRKFKEATGQTILEYLTEVRLNKAAELLKTSTLKVKEISVRVGYENISYFTQLFSKEFGVTPNEYKKMV